MSKSSSGSSPIILCHNYDMGREHNIGIMLFFCNHQMHFLQHIRTLNFAPTWTGSQTCNFADSRIHQIVGEASLRQYGMLIGTLILRFFKEKIRALCEKYVDRFIKRSKIMLTIISNQLYIKESNIRVFLFYMHDTTCLSHTSMIKLVKHVTLIM